MNYIKIIVLLFLVLIIEKSGFNQEFEKKYWIGFTDKENNSFSLANPEEFLSERAIERRNRQKINIGFSDLPVTSSYINSIKKFNLNILYSLKWFNGVVVELSDTNILEEIIKLNFVSEITSLYSPVWEKSYFDKFWFYDQQFINLLESLNYGYSENQIILENGQFLHERGYLGNNILIAILDAGFFKADSLHVFESMYQNNQILGTKDIVNPNGNVYNESSHGMKVLSVIGSNYPGQLIGTAPKAHFYLIRTEDVSSEYLIEEYNWAAGAEFADSIGADIINSSLGYYLFDDTTQNHSYEKLNGNTAIVTRAADMAASKGILVVTSAGNEGEDLWKHIISPCDGDSVLCVGAISTDSTKAVFSSFGPRIDGQIKPNIMAVGREVIVAHWDNSFVLGNGTSYSAPVISGLAACLWEAFPNSTNLQIFKAIEQSANQYNFPDSAMGYGIPDFEKAFYILFGLNIDLNEISSIRIFPNPFSNYLNIYLSQLNKNALVMVTIYNLSGQKIFEKEFNLASNFGYISLNNLDYIKSGIYILNINYYKESHTIKIVK